jgi:hypothetical protein
VPSHKPQRLKLLYSSSIARLCRTFAGCVCASVRSGSACVALLLSCRWTRYSHRGRGQCSTGNFIFGGHHDAETETLACIPPADLSLAAAISGGCLRGGRVESGFRRRQLPCLQAPEEGRPAGDRQGGPGRTPRHVTGTQNCLHPPATRSRGVNTLDGPRPRSLQAAQLSRVPSR